MVVAHERLGEEEGVRGAIGDAGDPVAHPNGEHAGAAIAVGVLHVAAAVVRAARPVGRGAVARMVVIKAGGSNVGVGRAHVLLELRQDNRRIFGGRGVVVNFFRHVEVDGVVEGRLFREGKRGRKGAPTAPVGIARAARGRIGIAILRGGLGENAVGVVIVVHGQPDLLQVVGALNAAGGFASRLNGGQQQSDQDRNNRDNNQKFDQSETRRRTTIRTLHGGISGVVRVEQGWSTSLSFVDKRSFITDTRLLRDKYFVKDSRTFHDWLRECIASCVH